MASSGTSSANFLTATTPSSTQVQTKANKKPNFVIPGRTNGVVPKMPPIGNTFNKYPHLFAGERHLFPKPPAPLPEATTPASGAHGRGLGTKGGKRTRRHGRKHRTRKHRTRKH